MAVAILPAAAPGPLADPFFLALESGAVHWSDLVEESTIVSKALEGLATIAEADDRIVEWWTEEYKTAERLDNWEVPDLTRRSDIADNFPVVLEPLEPTADGRERFRVMYDEDRLEEWANTRAESNDENAEYAEWVQTRLVFALKQYSYKYRVESVGGPGADHVVIFAMAHQSAPRRGRAAIPTLRSFPVMWDRDPADHTRHLIKPHMKRLSETDADPTEVILQLLDKLLECDDCTVEYMPVGAAATYIMTVIIPSAEPPAVSPPPPPSTKWSGFSDTVVPLAPSLATPSGSRAIDVMKAYHLAWDRDESDPRIHRIKRRAGDTQLKSRTGDSRIAELEKCVDCTVKVTPEDRVYMCVVTINLPHVAHRREAAREPMPAKIALTLTLDTSAAPAPHPAATAATAPVAMGGAGTFVRSAPAAAPVGPRAIDVMKNSKLAWDRDALDKRIHRIKRRAGNSGDIIAELQKCVDCTVEVTPKDRLYMCIVTMTR